MARRHIFQKHKYHKATGPGGKVRHANITKDRRRLGRVRGGREVHYVERTSGCRRGRGRSLPGDSEAQPDRPGLAAHDDLQEHRECRPLDRRAGSGVRMATGVGQVDGDVHSAFYAGHFTLRDARGMSVKSLEPGDRYLVVVRSWDVSRVEFLTPDLVEMSFRKVGCWRGGFRKLGSSGNDASGSQGQTCRNQLAPTRTGKGLPRRRNLPKRGLPDGQTFRKKEITER